MKPVTNPNHAAAQSVRIRLAVALEEALHAAGDSCPISHAATLAAGSLAEALRRHDLAVTDTRPQLPAAPGLVVTYGPPPDPEQARAAGYVQGLRDGRAGR